MKKLYLLFTVMAGACTLSYAQPTSSAPTPPARTASNVISVYSDAYTSLTGTDFNPNWGQTGFGSASEITIGSDKIRKYANINYQGMQFASSINAASMTSLHIDVWTSDCTSLDVYPIVPGQPEQFYKITTTLSGWTSIDIPLSTYTIPLNNIIQFKFVSTPFGGATVYLDNLYFWTNATLPTIVEFGMPVKKIGDAPFTISKPSSNSTGAFTYTSSNPDVATISGTTVTIVGAGTSTITATQAAAGIYSQGTANATLVVGYDAPSVPAPTPTIDPTKVISLFSDAYTNKAVDTWSANWDAADLLDTTIQGNNTKKYSNLVYSGIEFVGANSINITPMTYMHVDIWTPSSSPLKIKLVDFGADNAYGGGDDKASIEYVLTPAPELGKWKSYHIPLSVFTGLDTKAHLSQMLFVSSNSTVYFDNVYFSTEALPVSLLSFGAKMQESAVVLSWSTSNELNNQGFYVQRSADSKNWQNIGFVAAKSSSATYQFTDATPSNGINYYRLKQTDNDGKFAFSATVLANAAASKQLVCRLYPNPASSQLHVLYPSLQSKQANIQLIDMQGRIAQTFVLNQMNGSTGTIINISTLKKGNYMLKVQDGSTVYTSPIVLQ